MMSQSPILQNTVMELEEESINFKTADTTSCPVSNEAYLEACNEALELGQIISDTVIHYSENLEELESLMDDYENGDFMDFSDSIATTIMANSPESRSYGDTSEQVTTAASAMSPMPNPITDKDWFCLMFPDLCSASTTDTYDAFLNSNLNSDYDEIRFDMLSEMLEGGDRQDFLDYSNDMFTAIDSQSTGEEGGSEAKIVFATGAAIFFGVTLTWAAINAYHNSWDTNLPSSGPGAGNTGIGNLMALSMARGGVGFDTTGGNDLAPIIWVVILPLLGMGALMKGCESFDSECSASAPSTETLMHSLPTAFMKENPSYTSQFFASDAVNANDIQDRVLSNYAAKHGKILLSLQSDQCAPDEDLINFHETTNDLYVDLQYIPLERLSHSAETTEARAIITAGALAATFVAAIIIGIWTGLDGDATPGCGPTPPSGGSGEIIDAIRDGDTFETMGDSQSPDSVQDYVELLDSFVEISGLNQDTSSRLVLISLIVNDRMGPYYGSQTLLTQLLPFMAHNAGHEATSPVTPTTTNCTGWNDASQCREVIDEVNMLAWHVDVLETSFDAYMPLINPIATSADDTESRATLPYYDLEKLTKVQIWINMLLLSGGYESQDWPLNIGQGVGIDTIPIYEWDNFDDRVREANEEKAGLLEMNNYRNSDTSGRDFGVTLLVILAGAAITWMAADATADIVNANNPPSNGGGPGFWVCGNNQCDPNEDAHTCASDCGYGQGAGDYAFKSLEVAYGGGSIAETFRSNADGSNEYHVALIYETNALDPAYSAFALAKLDPTGYSTEPDGSEPTAARGAGVEYLIDRYLELCFWIASEIVGDGGTVAGGSTTNTIGPIDLDNPSGLSVSTIDAQVETYRVLSTLPDDWMNTVPVQENGSMDWLEALENKFFGTQSTMCLVESGYGSVISAEASARSDGIINDALALLYAFLNRETTTDILSSGGSNSNDYGMTIDMMINKDSEDPFEIVPIWPPETDPLRLEFMEKMWGVADVAYHVGIDQGLSEAEAHTFAIGMAMIAGSVENIGPLEPSENPTTARALLPVYGYMVLFWINLFIISGGVGYVVGDSSGVSGCWDDDYNNDDKRLLFPNPDWDGDGILNSLEVDPNCWDTPVNSRTTDKGCMMAEDLKDGTGDGTSDSTSDSSDEDEDDDGFLPGFGFMSTLISLLGVAILLQRKQREDND